MSTPNLPSTLKPNQKPCPQCGKPMHRQSPRCRTCYMAQHAQPANYVERTCKQCGILFVVHVSQVTAGWGHYCSQRCRSLAHPRQSVRPFVACSTCGKQFRKYRCEIRKNKSGKHFCCHDCWYAFNVRDNHYLWTGGQNERMNPDGLIWRKAVLKRDKRHCRLCLASTRLEAHHILPFGTYPAVRWDVANGITLCHACHRRLQGHEMEHVAALQLLASVPVVASHVKPGSEPDTAALAEVLPAAQCHEAEK